MAEVPTAELHPGEYASAIHRIKYVKIDPI